jgi:hypothetical protein
MQVFRHPTDSDTRLCPQCKATIVFRSRYPVLTIGMAPRAPNLSAKTVRDERAWICRNGGCDYRERMGDE